MPGTVGTTSNKEIQRETGLRGGTVYPIPHYTFPRKEGSGNLAWPLEPKIPPSVTGDPTCRAGKSRRHKVHEKAHRRKVLKPLTRELVQQNADGS